MYTDGITIHANTTCKCTREMTFDWLVCGDDSEYNGASFAEIFVTQNAFLFGTMSFDSIYDYVHFK